MSVAGEWLAKRIMDTVNPLKCTECITKRPDLKAEIDSILTESGRQDLIVL